MRRGPVPTTPAALAAALRAKEEAEAAAAAAAKKASASPQKPPPKSNNIRDRAQRAGVDLDATDIEKKVVDDLNPERVFNLRFKVYETPDGLDRLEELSRIEELRAFVESAKRIDAENLKRYAFNQTQEAQLKILMARLGQPNWKLHRPALHHENANKVWQRKIRETTIKTIAAIELLSTRGRYPVRDYKVDEACDLADDIVIKDFIDKQQRGAPARHDIRALLPSDHCTRCNCNFTWDGRSKFCNGTAPNAERAQVTWRTADDFCFLDPEFEMVCPLEGQMPS